MPRSSISLPRSRPRPSFACGMSTPASEALLALESEIAALADNPIGAALIRDGHISVQIAINRAHGPGTGCDFNPGRFVDELEPSTAHTRLALRRFAVTRLPRVSAAVEGFGAALSPDLHKLSLYGTMRPVRGGKRVRLNIENLFLDGFRAIPRTVSAATAAERLAFFESGLAQLPHDPIMLPGVDPAAMDRLQFSVHTRGS